MAKTKKTAKKGSGKKKKQSLLSSIFLAIILVLGAGIILYPSVSDWWNSFHQSRAIANYQNIVEQIDDGKKQAMLEAAYAYNARLGPGTHLDLSDEELEEYKKILDVSGTGIMGYINIPSISVNLPIYHTAEETVLQIAVGHIPGTSLPVGGKTTHAVLSGHRGLPSAKLFTDLDRLVEGDIFTVTVLGEVVTYQIDQIKIVLPQEISDLAIESGRDYITLITCTPYGINSHRMLVRGRRIDNLETYEDIIITAEASRISTTAVMLAIAGVLAILSMLISLISAAIRGPRKSRKKLLKELEDSIDIDIDLEDK